MRYPFEGKSRSLFAAGSAEDLELLRQLWVLIGSGLAVFCVGFEIWHLDNVHCAKLRLWRRELGLPWGILLEGHGWWHLMTGYGSCVAQRRGEFFAFS